MTVPGARTMWRQIGYALKTIVSEDGDNVSTIGWKNMMVTVSGNKIIATESREQGSCLIPSLHPYNL